MFAGKPVVATDVGGVSEMIHHQETGLLIKPSDSGALAGAIIRLLQNEDMRKVIGQNAQKLANTEFTVEHYSKRIVVDLWHGLYRYSDKNPGATMRGQSDQCPLG